jgi:hypothetical protein
LKWPPLACSGVWNNPWPVVVILFTSIDKLIICSSLSFDFWCYLEFYFPDSIYKQKNRTRANASYKMHSPVFRFLVDSTNLRKKVIYNQWLLTSNDKNDQICDVGFCRMHSPVSCFFVYKSNLGNKIPNNIKNQTTKRNI